MKNTLKDNIKFFLGYATYVLFLVSGAFWLLSTIQ